MPFDSMDTTSDDARSGTLTAEQVKTQANEEYNAGRYAEAVRLYSQAIVQSPSNATYYGNRAAALIMLKKYKEAAADCRTATDLDPTMVKAYMRAGKCQLNMGDLLESQRQYQLALTIEPHNRQTQKELVLLNSVGGHIAQGQMYIENKHYPLALSSLARAITMVDADNVPLKWKILKAECYIGKKDYIQAGNIANEILLSDSQNPDALYLRAQVFYAQGENTKAISHCTEAMRCDPDYSKARALLKRARQLEAQKEAGNTAFKAGNFEEAYSLYTSALDIDPENEGTNSKLYSNRATVSMKLNKYEEAVKDYDTALKLDPNFTKAFSKRGQCHSKLEHFEEAVQDYKQAVDQDKANREYRALLAEAERALKKSQQKDYYKLLGLTKDCTDADIKKAYRKLALQYHPDKNAGDDKAEARFKEIGEAYTILSDPNKRYRFDSGADLDGMGGLGGFRDPGGFRTNVDDMFSEFFGQGHGHSHGHSHGFPSGGPFGSGGIPSGFPSGGPFGSGIPSGFPPGGPFGSGGIPSGFPGSGARSRGRGGSSTRGFR